MKKVRSDVACWFEHYGLWPGQTWAKFAAYSRWIHLSTNTLPFYNTFPLLQHQYPSNEFNTFGDDQSSANHWLHESTDKNEIFHLSGSMRRWLRMKDGCHVLLANKTEVGNVYIPERGMDPNRLTPQGEYIPEHVHYDYLNTKAYEESQKARGVTAAA